MTNIAGPLVLALGIRFVVVAVFKDRIEDSFKGTVNKVEEHTEIKPNVRLNA
jgi:hypothetical protein